jgi:arylamine N-acetyltransferase
MDTSAYLKRIRDEGPLTPTADTLRRLHVAHLLSVPFENLSIHAGEPIVLQQMCGYHQTSPESPFTQNRVCSLVTRDGRITISDMRLIRTTGDAREEWPLSTEAEYLGALREHFGIHAIGPAHMRT